jgi:hypothetical protein
MSSDNSALVPDAVGAQGTEGTQAATASGPAETAGAPDAVALASAEHVPPAVAEPPLWPAPAPPAPPAPRRRRPPKWLLPAVGGVVVAALVVGLVVWAPWSPRPAAPASLTATSPTGTSVRLSWPAPAGGATPAHYVILRDGVQVAKVPASETSWTDRGLMPGQHFTYEVATRGGGRQSSPSRPATVTTLAPSPVGLKVTSTYTSATVSWKPSPLAPAPDKYVVYNGSDRVASLGGSTTTYVNAGETQGAGFQYTVVAEWGAVRSAPSAPDFGTIRQAPLEGGESVSVTPTSIPSGGTGATVGTAFPETWEFTPQCSGTACTMDVGVVLLGINDGSVFSTVKVSPSGDGYTGSIQAKLASCVGIETTDTLAVTLTPKTSDISNGAWGDWTGTAAVTMPYTSAGDDYCPSQSWNFSLSSKGQG